MKTVSMLEFRRNSQRVLQAACRGQRMIVTYRGKPVCRLEPIEDSEVSTKDAFYTLGDLASKSGSSLTNDEMDRLVYEG